METKVISTSCLVSTVDKYFQLVLGTRDKQFKKLCSQQQTEMSVTSNKGLLCEPDKDALHQVSSRIIKECVGSGIVTAT